VIRAFLAVFAALLFGALIGVALALAGLRARMPDGDR
jgi:hypothetical protein